MSMRSSRAVRRRRAARVSGRATVPFAAFLAWAPSGTSPPERASIALCREVKRDGHLASGSGRACRNHGDPDRRNHDHGGEWPRPVLASAVALLRCCLPADLAAFFSPATLLVPVPGHAPRPPRSAAWVPRRLCEELLRAGLGARWEPLLVRRMPVVKSACAGRGRRPTVRDHYESLAVRPQPGSGALGEETTDITLIDDVITKGATLLAGACRLAEAFPRATVRAFALLRTQNPASHPRHRQVFRTLIDPVCASISLSRYGAWRHDP